MRPDIQLLEASPTGWLDQTNGQIVLSLRKLRALPRRCQLVPRLLRPECHTVPVPISARLWVRAGANQCRLAMLSLPKFGAPSGFENPGVKKTDRNKIREISSAPLTEQTIVVVALFPFAGRGWMQKKPFERVFQTLICVLTGTADWEPRAGDPCGPGHRYVWIGVGPYSDLSCEPE